MPVTINETPTEIMILSAKEGAKETLLVIVMKSLWYTVALWLLICGGSVIFMGIEGNHQMLVQWRNLEELEMFNKSLYKWITKNEGPHAKRLRASIGLHEHLEEAAYEKIAGAQMELNFTNMHNRMKANCTLANHDLKSWHNMTQSWGDSFMYAVSILSTVGWGVHVPPSHHLRVGTLIYAMLGLPIFTAFIGYQIDFVKHVENCMKKNEFVKNYLGGGTTINACMGVVMLTVALIYSKISLIMVNEEKKNPEIHHDLAVIGELDHWDYFTTIYFTFQTVSTIGFGDEFIHSPEKGAMSFIKPIFIILFTAFLIALFAHIFGKIQRRMDKRAAKRSVESSMALQSMSQKVKKASQAVNHKMLFETNEPSEILKRLQSLREENGQNDGFDAMLMGRHRVISNRIHEEGGGTDNSQPSDSQPSSSTATV